MSHILKLILWLVGLIILAGVLSLLYIFVSGGMGTSSTTSNTLPPSLQQLGTQMTIGSYSDAISTYNSVMSDPSSTPDDKALALDGVTGAQYLLSGNMSDLLANVDQLKQTAIDPSVSLSARATTIDTLALTYVYGSGDPSIPAEIFTGTPFTNYYVAGDPNTSDRNLFEWSFNLYPNPVAALHIAKWYGDQFVTQSDLSASTSKSYISSAEQFLNKGQEELVNKSQGNPSFMTSSLYYEDYQFWEALVIGRLAAQGVSPYTTEYQDEFNQFITFAQGSTDNHAQLLLPYARYNYAEDLSYIDKTQATAQLNILAQELNALPVSSSSTGFVRIIRNSYTYPSANEPTGDIWNNVESLMKLSPAFTSAINRIVAGAPAPSTTASAAAGM